MAQLITWDDTGKRYFETGVDHGVLYPQKTDDGTYPEGFPWNGLTAVTESPSGAESNPQYADNSKYLNLISVEEFGATIEAFTYPDEFAECDGSVSPVAGVVVGQQARKPFGLCYRTRVGNDVAGDSLGYKLHLVWGCLAAPSEKAYATVSDSPEAIAFSWEVTTTPVAVVGYRPVACIVIDSRTADPTDLATLETALFGSTPSTKGYLPTPTAVLAMFPGS